MSEAELGLWLMGGSCVVMGLVFGFRLNKYDDTDAWLVGNHWWEGILASYLYFTGAVALEPAARTRGLDLFLVGYPIATVFIGLVMLVVASLVGYCIFSAFNEFVKMYYRRVINAPDKKS